MATQCHFPGAASIAQPALRVLAIRAVTRAWCFGPAATGVRRESARYACARASKIGNPVCSGQMSSKSRNASTGNSPLSDTVARSKQVVQVTDQLYHYILQHTREPQILRELREETAGRLGSQMMVSPDQAQLLAMLVQIMGAERCIEVGVFTGYSSLAVALVLPEWGRLVACEREESCLAIARKYYERAEVSHKVDVRHGLALESLNDMLQNGEGGSYDFAFIDADKRMYHQYYELLLQLVRHNGLVVVDNVLWHGTVADPLVVDKKTQSLRDFNKFLLSDARVSISMVPIGDGMTLCRKL